MSDRVEYLHLAPNAAIPETRNGGRFRAVLVVERAADTDWRNDVCTWLVQSGCSYAVVWGHECSIWHDCVDEAELALNDHNFDDDDKLVMTTWHENESIDEAFWFAGVCAFHPTIELDRTLLIDITDSPRGDELVARYAEAISKVPP